MLGTTMLARLVTAICRRPALTVIAALLLALLGGWYSAVALRINTSASDMISPDVPFRQHDKAYDAAFPNTEDRIVVVIDAPSPDQGDAAADRLAELMRGHPDILSNIKVPSADPYFRRYGLLFLATDKLQDLATRLAGAQAALGMLNEDPNLRGLARMLDLVLGNVGGEAPAGLTDLLGRLADAAESINAGTPKRLSWTGLVSGGDEDRLGNRRFVLAQPSLDNASFARGRPSLSAAEEAIATLRTEPVGQGVTARITGDMALRQAELDTVAGSAGIATVLSFVLVSAVLIVGMRSGRLIGAVMVTLVAGLLLAAAVAALSVGQLNLISVTCAVMFFGLGDDFGSHLSLRYQEELRGGLSPVPAVVAASVGVGPALTLSTLCAAIGFMSFVPTDYLGLAEFGIISGLGMFVALAISLTLLPALIVLLKPGPGAPAMQKEDRGFAVWVERHSRRILIVSGIAAIGSLLALPLVRLDVNPLNLQDTKAEAVRTYRDLASRPETSPYSVNILAANLDAAQGMVPTLRGLPGVGGVQRCELRAGRPGCEARHHRRHGAVAGPSLYTPTNMSALNAEERKDALADMRRALGQAFQGDGKPEAISAGWTAR